MNLGLLEDHDLYALASEVVPEAGSGVDNSQVTGLLSAVQASGSYATLCRMTQHQLEKARKDGERGEARAAFYDRLFKALQKVERFAKEHANELGGPNAAKAETRRLRERWSGRFATTLMTHVAAEHRWRGRDQ